ncbi:MAG: hypothetical protein NXI30_03745 [bacterium]|nr:hypothetical protein [bacterium]
MSDEQQSRESAREDAYFSALVNAWFTTRMEKDRTLLALSAGGVALLVGLLTGFGARSLCHLVLYLLAAAAFLAAIFSAIAVFGGNARYLEKEKESFESSGAPTGRDRNLERLDWTLGASFFAGVILTVAVALVSAWPATNPVEDPMSAKPSKGRTTKPSPPKTVKKSLSGASSMRPSKGPQGSGSGAKPSGGSSGSSSSGSGNGGGTSSGK